MRSIWQGLTLPQRIGLCVGGGLAALFVLLLLVLAASGRKAEEAERKGKQAVKASAVPEQDKTVYLAVQIWNEFREDPRAARDRWGGKRIRLRGHLWQIKGNSAYLACVNREFGNLVTEAVECRCTLPLPNNLQREDEIVVEGRCGRSLFLQRLLVEDCRFIEKRPADH